MELNIIEENNKKIVLEIKGETHTFCNMIKKELWNDKHVKAAGYNIEHPFIGVPKLVVETDGEDPRKVLTDAIKRLDKTADEFKQAFVKLK